MKRISEKKLEAFTVGTMGKRPLSKREIEEQKKKEDEEAAAHAFKEFVETFQDTPTPSSKVWIKAGTYDAGSRREDKSEKGKLYKPTSRLEDKSSSSDKAQEYAKILASELKKDSVPVKKKEKKKSNLELFKEELRQIQEEREERHKYKHIASQAASASHSSSTLVSSTSDSGSSSHLPEIRDTPGSFDNGDPNTTNLYLGNLSPKISEQQLMEIFGRYGPLASIKIMWPRSEEEKQRGRNCGFVAYMSRKDAERALKTLHGRYVMGHEMRLGWGKSVPIMNQPIFIPHTMLELTTPPPPSGLPFNAQPPPKEADFMTGKNYKELTSEEEKENMEKLLEKSVVRVFIPTEKSVLNVIHRMIEFVIREGPNFEALVMSREMENPLFSFLFENESPAHIYYRWKLFSLLQGDTPDKWSEKEFRMFQGGPIWKPPCANFYTQGMPDELVVDPDAPEIHKGALSSAQRERLESLIRHLTPERTKIGEAMIFCIEHADAADEICECIAESLANPKTIASKKIARLYLLSDILHNCTVKVANASFFRKAVEKQLVEIFENMNIFFASYESRLKAEGLKSRVLSILNTWEEWAVYPKDFLRKLRSIFLGKHVDEPKEEPPEDVDGTPLSGDEKDDEDLDGVPLDGAALLKGALMRSMPEAMAKGSTPGRNRSQDTSRDMDYNDDIDGVPLDDDIDGIPLDASPKAGGSSSKSGGAFIPSKWETVDPEQVEAQAITTSKWDSLDPPEPPKFTTYDEDSNSNEGNSYSEEKRSKLREIEVKVMQYQDELECGRRQVKPGWSISEMVEHYRKKLLRKDTSKAGDEMVDSPLSYMFSKDRESGSRGPHSRDSDSPETSRHGRSARKRSRSRSPYTSSSSRHRERESPPYRNRSRDNKSSRRNRSRSPSDSPKRYAKRSPSPMSYSSSRSSSRRDERSRDDAYSSNGSSPAASSSSRYRSDKHKHKHKH